jgi:hypothetical protein
MKMKGIEAQGTGEPGPSPAGRGLEYGTRRDGWPIVSRLVRWRHYEVGMGLVMPVICFALEPLLLPALGWLPGLIFFHRYRIFGYGVVALELVALAVWLRYGDRLGRWSAGFAGVLLAGALFAEVLGLVLLPFSVLGLPVFLIGALGFVPLFTAHVFYRNGVRAYRRADAALGKRALYEAVLWGAILAYGVPGLLQLRVTRATRSDIDAVIRGDDAASSAAVGRLRPYRWVADFDSLREAYEQEPDPTRKQRIARAYGELTGHDVRSGPDRLVEY